MDAVLEARAAIVCWLALAPAPAGADAPAIDADLRAIFSVPPREQRELQLPGAEARAKHVLQLAGAPPQGLCLVEIFYA